jgi:multiple sugar transport system substrate-binding protein
MNKEVSVALVTGPAYDPLYERLRGFTEASGVRVSVGFGGDHPSLNKHLASLAEVPYDLVSTHTKYAPSQLDFLAPLDGLVGPAGLEDFVPLILELASVGGGLYGVPRNIAQHRRAPATLPHRPRKAPARHLG